MCLIKFHFNPSLVMSKSELDISLIWNELGIIDPRGVNYCPDPTPHDPEINGLNMGLIFFLSESGRVGFGST
jgi:hypothetical protein